MLVETLRAPHGELGQPVAGLQEEQPVPAPVEPEAVSTSPALAGIFSAPVGWNTPASSEAFPPRAAGEAWQNHFARTQQLRGSCHSYRVLYTQWAALGAEKQGMWKRGEPLTEGPQAHLGQVDDNVPLGLLGCSGRALAASEQAPNPDFPPEEPPSGACFALGPDVTVAKLLKDFRACSRTHKKQLQNPEKRWLLYANCAGLLQSGVFSSASHAERALKPLHVNRDKLRLVSLMLKSGPLPLHPPPAFRTGRNPEEQLTDTDKRQLVEWIRHHAACGRALLPSEIELGIAALKLENSGLPYSQDLLESFRRSLGARLFRSLKEWAAEELPPEDQLLVKCLGTRGVQEACCALGGWSTALLKGSLPCSQSVGSWREAFCSPLSVAASWWWTRRAFPRAPTL